MASKFTDSSLFDGTAVNDESTTEQYQSEYSKDRALSAEAETWISCMPRAVRPIQLSESFPRICNRLAACWHQPKIVIALFDDLLIEKRGVRQGFPLAIVMELTTLKEHFMESYTPRKKVDVWNRNSNRY